MNSDTEWEMFKSIFKVSGNTWGLILRQHNKLINRWKFEGKKKQVYSGQSRNYSHEEWKRAFCRHSIMVITFTCIYNTLLYWMIVSERRSPLHWQRLFIYFLHGAGSQQNLNCLSLSVESDNPHPTFKHHSSTASSGTQFHRNVEYPGTQLLSHVQIRELCFLINRSNANVVRRIVASPPTHFSWSFSNSNYYLSFIKGKLAHVWWERTIEKHSASANLLILVGWLKMRPLDFFFFRVAISQMCKWRKMTA